MLEVLSVEVNPFATKCKLEASRSDISPHTEERSLVFFVIESVILTLKSAGEGLNFLVI